MAKTITITINTGNAAFEDDWGGEVANMLHALAARLFRDEDVHNASLYDTNGNSCGKITVVEDD